MACHLHVVAAVPVVSAAGTARVLILSFPPPSFCCMPQRVVQCSAVQLSVAHGAEGSGSLKCLCVKGEQLKVRWNAASHKEHLPTCTCSTVGCGAPARTCLHMGHAAWGTCGSCCYFLYGVQPLLMWSIRHMSSGHFHVGQPCSMPC